MSRNIWEISLFISIFVTFKLDQSQDAVLLDLKPPFWFNWSTVTSFLWGNKPSWTFCTTSLVATLNQLNTWNCTWSLTWPSCSSSFNMEVAFFVWFSFWNNHGFTHFIKHKLISFKILAKHQCNKVKSYLLPEMHLSLEFFLCGFFFSFNWPHVFYSFRISSSKGNSRNLIFKGGGRTSLAARSSWEHLKAKQNSLSSN